MTVIEEAKKAAERGFREWIFCLQMSAWILVGGLCMWAALWTVLQISGIMEQTHH